MTDSLLSFSGVNLFGQRLLELRIVNPLQRPREVIVATSSRLPGKDWPPTGSPLINGVDLSAGDTVIVWKQAQSDRNKLYEAASRGKPWVEVPVDDDVILKPAKGRKYKGFFLRLGDGFEYLGGENSRILGTFNRLGANRQLEEQLKDGRFARIYGFSYEGIYYDLPKPTIFLVHGDGELVSEDTGLFNLARAPRPTTLTGIGASYFDFSDGLRVWSYDQADYTIRMDVEVGMFEQVLLDAMFDGGGPGGFDASGMNARGMNARGMNARGMNARGMNARGMNARGMNARGGNSD